MPHTRSAKKRLRQNKKQRLKNRSARSTIKTHSKRVETAVAKGDLALAERELVQAISKLDKAGKTRVYHKNTVSRKKSRLARMVAALRKTAGGEGPQGTA